MEQYSLHIDKTITLVRKLFKELEAVSTGKLSSNDITPERLLWEVFNKIFSILVTLENSLRFKDSLSNHLVARYTYEMLIIFAYVFTDKNLTLERATKFLSFNQFQNMERKWTDLDLTSMINSLLDNSRFTLHKGHYRNLCNFAHPSMDSFMLNRRGEAKEVKMILSTTLLTVGTLIEILKICLEEDLYFDEKPQIMSQVLAISLEADLLMRELRTL